jgi:hypothetical protein
MKNGKEKFEEKLLLEGMPPDVKKFYAEFKKNNPGNEEHYYSAFVEMKIQENQKKLQEEQDRKKLAEQVARSARNPSFSLWSN